MKITPYSDLNTAAKLAITSANFPALKHAFLASGISGLNLIDSISGKVISCASGWVQPASGQFRAGGACATSGALWNAPGTSAALFVATGSFSLTSVKPMQFGDALSTTGVDLSAGSSAGVTKDGGNYDTMLANGVITGAQTGIAIALPAGGGQSTRYVTDSALNTTAGAVTHVGSLASLVIAESSSVTTNSSSYLTGAFMFVFTALPTDIAAAMAWMAGNPGVVYPGWKGRI